MKVRSIEFIGFEYYLMNTRLLFGWQVEALGRFVANDNYIMDGAV